MSSHSAEGGSGTEEDAEIGTHGMGDNMGDDSDGMNDVNRDDNDALRIVDILDEERKHQSPSHDADSTPTLNHYKIGVQTDNGPKNGDIHARPELGAESPAESVNSAPDDTPSIQVEAL